MTKILLAGLVFWSSCGKNDRSDSVLRKRVEQYCHDLAWSLDHATKRYAELAPALDDDQLAPDQRTRIESTLLADSIGATTDARVAHMRSIDRRFGFCVGVRRDKKPADEIFDRAHVLVQALAEQFPIAELAGKPVFHADAAKLLGELAALAHEVDRLPLVE